MQGLFFGEISKIVKYREEKEYTPRHRPFLTSWLFLFLALSLGVGLIKTLKLHSAHCFVYCCFFLLSYKHPFISYMILHPVYSVEQAPPRVPVHMEEDP